MKKRRQSVRHIERYEAWVYKKYLAGRLTFEDVQVRFEFSRSTFYRRLARFKEGGKKALAHRLRGKRSPKVKSFRAVKRQVLALYRRGPSLFCSYFYRLNRRRFLQPVGYSTVRKWLRQAKLLRRFPNGVAVTQPMVWMHRIVDSRPLAKPREGMPLKWRRNTPWEMHERWKSIWFGWEKPGYGVRTPTAAERLSFENHVEATAPRTPWIRAGWVRPETPFDEFSLRST